MIDYDPEIYLNDVPVSKKKRAQKKVDKSNLMDMVVSEDTVFAFKEHNTADIYRIRRLTPSGVPSWEKTGYRGAVDGLAAEGIALPKTVPVGRLHFDPAIGSNHITLLDDGTYRVNTYVPPSWAIRPKKPDLDSSLLLEAVERDTPTMHKYFLHIAAGDKRVARRMMLWIISQIRHEGGRVRTAWILRGDQGSGKSMLVNVVLRGMMKVGRLDENCYCTSKSMQNMKEQYNGWVVENLFCLVDEADIMSIPYRDRKELYNKFKMLVTNPQLTVRMMHKDQIDATPHAAFVFTSNERQLFEIEETDRRFHVADYVEGNVSDALGFETEAAFISAIERELESFAKTLNRVVLTDSDRREVDKPDMTDEKIGLIDSSRTIPAQFVHALATADLDALWALMSDALYASPMLAEEPQVKMVIATAAIIARSGGGIFHLPGRVVDQMYAMATVGGKYPKVIAVLRERKMVIDAKGYSPSVRNYDPAILEAADLPPRTRGLHIAKEWTSEDNFLELLDDRFIAAWIKDATRREGSEVLRRVKAVSTTANIDDYRKEA